MANSEREIGLIDGAFKNLFAVLKEIIKEVKKQDEAARGLRNTEKAMNMFIRTYEKTDRKYLVSDFLQIFNLILPEIASLISADDKHWLRSSKLIACYGAAQKDPSNSIMLDLAKFSQFTLDFAPDLEKRYTYQLLNIFSFCESRERYKLKIKLEELLGDYVDEQPAAPTPTPPPSLPSLFQGMQPGAPFDQNAFMNQASSLLPTFLPTILGSVQNILSDPKISEQLKTLNSQLNPAVPIAPPAINEKDTQ